MLHVAVESGNKMAMELNRLLWSLGTRLAVELGEQGWL